MTLQPTAPTKIDENVIPLTLKDTSQLVPVAAPADLEAGYTFDASHNGKIFRVTVPEGGVKMGDHIMVSMPENSDNSVPVASPVVQDMAIPGFLAVTYEEGMTRDPFVADPLAAGPIGHWREGFCDCCRHGCAEPTCCLAFWCNGMALGQVMTRLKLNVVARPTTCCAKTFAIVSALWFMYLVINLVAYALTMPALSTMYYDYYTTESGLSISTLSIFIAAALLSIYFICIGTATRRRMRKAFKIAGSCFGDCCAFFWCSCCTVTQMARHTHDNRVHKSSCCSKNGLMTGAPDIV